MAKVLCIVRSSTEAQEIESQKKELIEFCKTKGFADRDMLFIEAQGASARSLNKKYIKMLEDIKSTILNDSEIKSVAVWALNRLGRVESKLHEMKEFFVKNRIQVYCKDPSFKLLKEDGTEDTAGSMMFSVYAAMVKLDTEEMFAKMQRGKKRNAEIGKLERQLESAKNPTFDNLLEYADDLSSTDIKKMKDIVNQHISKVWFDAEECNLFNGKVKTCKHIHIIDENGKDWEFIYISHLPWKGFEKKLYKLVDGKMIPHWRTEEHELLASIATYQLIKGNGD